MKYRIFFISLGWFITAMGLPEGFVYLKDIDPTIQQEMRYSTHYNFIGLPIRGYESAECILTRPTALALTKIQHDLKKIKLSLRVYDCYRPQMAVDEFIDWSQQSSQQQMKAEFYPRVDKIDFFKLGYVAAKSGHTRGSTVDLTIAPLSSRVDQSFQQKNAACFESKRFHDGSLDMGTNFDCMDVLSHTDAAVGEKAHNNRMLLKNLMEKYGFVPYSEEWWHFTLKKEPFPNVYFNFPIAESISGSRIISSN